MAKLTPQQRLDRTHVALLRNDQTLIMSGILMLGKSSITNNPANPTAWTNGLDKQYDEKFFMSLDDAEARALVVHENIHVLFKHTLVWKHLWKLNARKANVAADYVVNAFIKKLDPTEAFLKPIHKEPGIWLYDAKYDNMDVGEVYRRLPDAPPQGGKGAPGGAGDGTMDGHSWEDLDALSQEEREELAREIDQAIRQGAIVAGKVTKGADRTFDGLMEPKVDWRKVMREWVETYCDGRDEATWRRPNRRWLQYDIYMPSMQGVSVGDIGIFVDTSGSTYVGNMLAKFMSEVNAICLSVQPEKLHLVYWENEVAGHEVYTREQMGNVIATTKPKGGGGTSPSCCPKYLAANNIKLKAAIVLSDGYVGGDWGGTWPCPVLWVIIGDKNACPTTGTVVHAEEF